MLRHSLLVCVALGATIPAQTASYSLRGVGCNGSPVSACIAQNDTAPSLRIASLPNEYAYPVTNTSGMPMQIIGFEIFTQSNGGGTVTGNTAIYLDNAGAGALSHSSPAFAATATGTITVSGTAGWFTTIVAPAVTVQPGECFWLGVDAFSAIAPPQNNGGSPGPTAPWWRRPNYLANAWVVSGSVSNPILRVQCAAGSTPVPTLTATSAPRLGQSFTLNLTGGTPGLAGFVAWGFNDTFWLAWPTPVDLVVFGAPGCFTYTSTDSNSLVLLDPAGAATQAIAVPNQPSLAGFTFFNQGAVIAPGVNALAMLTSNYGRGVVGN